MVIFGGRVGALLLTVFIVASSCGKGEKANDKPGLSDSGIGEAISKNGVFRAQLSWKNQLAAGNDVNNSADLDLLQVDGGRFAGVVAVTGFHPKMPAMGHGTNEDDQVIRSIEDKNGHFAIENVHFIMSGRAESWVVDIHGTVDGVSDVASVKLPEVR